MVCPPTSQFCLDFLLRYKKASECGEMYWFTPTTIKVEIAQLYSTQWDFQPQCLSDYSTKQAHTLQPCAHQYNTYIA